MTIEKYRRLQEIIFDISFNLGCDWKALDVDFRGQIMNRVNGSRGLSDLVQQWADEFDTVWETRLSNDEHDYIEDIGNFTYEKLGQLCGETAKQRFTQQGETNELPNI